jgi:hypothetical protein
MSFRDEQAYDLQTRKVPICTKDQGKSDYLHHFKTHPMYKFMSFRDAQAYDLQTVFTQEKLATIRPAEIVRWMCQKAYGNPNPGPDDNPTLRRSSTTEYSKKTHSCYMVNRAIAWNAVSQVGNPTRSIEVYDLIKRTKRKRPASRERGASHLPRLGMGQTPSSEFSILRAC